MQFVWDRDQDRVCKAAVHERLRIVKRNRFRNALQCFFKLLLPDIAYRGDADVRAEPGRDIIKMSKPHIPGADDAEPELLFLIHSVYL